MGQLRKRRVERSTLDLPELTVAEAQAAFARCERTGARLCEAHLKRIATIDQAEPMLRSVIEFNPDASEIAAALIGGRLAHRFLGIRFGSVSKNS